MKTKHPGIMPSNESADALIQVKKKQICDILDKLGAKSEDYFNCGEYINCIFDIAYNLGCMEQLDHNHEHN